MDISEPRGSHLLNYHLKKNDLADEVFVVNKNGYIGKSTRREIKYAKSKGKPMQYMEESKKESNENSK